MSVSIALLICGAYIALLFVLAFYFDRRARQAGVRGRLPAWVFTLSISVYCTSWTFYGSVGFASRSGLEYTAIYLGPTLIFIGWWFLLRKIVRITKQQRITSIADFISARFGKSGRVAAIATLIALIASTPYIALQLKAVAQSFDLIAGRDPSGTTLFSDTAFWVAGFMALFAVLFGARSGSADEHYPGVIAAIAFEAMVKLIALLALGIFVFVQLSGIDWRSMISDVDFQRITSLPADNTARWISLMFLSGVAVLCLPRQFQVTMVEATDERHFRTASWLFPLYLLLISAFVVPIAISGYVFVGPDANPDQFVLTVPLSFGNQAMATLAFIGGFSSATSMVIVASIALSIMMSNHLIMPLVLRLSGNQRQGALGRRLLLVRQASIIVVVLVGFVYYRVAGQSDALAAMGLIAFVGVAQFFPALLLALFWRQASENGAFAALLTGLAVWGYTLLLPTLFPTGTWVADGLFGLEVLRPQAMLGATGLDPVVHSVFWSLALNAAVLVVVSAFANRSPLEQLQERLFVDAFQQRSLAEGRVWRRSAPIGDLRILLEQVLGRTEAIKIFKPHSGENAAPALIAEVEQELSASIGAATARTLVARVSKGETLSVDDIVGILDQTQQAVEYAKQLEEKSTQLEATAGSLRKALVQVRRLDRFKDDFLSQISHELRTPMTALRSFTEILFEEAEDQSLTLEQRKRYLTILSNESERLTGLLDEILDVQKNTRAANQDVDQEFPLIEAIEDALDTFIIERDRGRMQVHLDQGIEGVRVRASKARIVQVFVNLLSNALKYGNSEQVRIEIRGNRLASSAQVTFADDGPGIREEMKDQLFTKFTRITDDGSVGGTGLGLAICRQILRSMGGSIRLANAEVPGAKFEILIPLASQD